MKLKRPAWFTPELERNIDIAVYFVLCIAFWSASLYIINTGMDLGQASGVYAYDKTAEIRDASTLEWPINDTTVALKTSELAFFMSVIIPGFVCMFAIVLVFAGVGLHYFGRFWRAWKNIKEPMDRLDEVEERVKRLEAWRKNGRHVGRHEAEYHDKK